MKQLLVKKQNNAGQTSAESEEIRFQDYPFSSKLMEARYTDNIHAAYNVKPIFLFYTPVVRMKQYFCLKNAIKYMSYKLIGAPKGKTCRC